MQGIQVALIKSEASTQALDFTPKLETQINEWLKEHAEDDFQAIQLVEKAPDVMLAVITYKPKRKAEVSFGNLG